MNNNYPTKTDSAPLSIVVVCHKHDFFFTKICIASIRYYYPNITIYLVKDLVNGQFSTTCLERYLHVNVLHLGVQKFGYTSAKLFLIASKKLAGKKLLVLDSDMVFIGDVLEKLMPYLDKYDFIVSPDLQTKPGTKNFTPLYYDTEWVRLIFPNLRHQKFAFNGGHIVITPGLISSSDFMPYFNHKKYPFWNTQYSKQLPLRDQSLLNILLPLYAQQKRITLHQIYFSKWSEGAFVRHTLTVEDVIHGKYHYVIHWAGSKRDADVRDMTRGDILNMFQKYYYSKIPFGLPYLFFKRVLYKIKHI